MKKFGNVKARHSVRAFVVYEIHKPNGSFVSGQFKATFPNRFLRKGIDFQVDSIVKTVEKLVNFYPGDKALIKNFKIESLRGAS